MKIGIIFCAFQMEDYVQRSISPWIEARDTKVGGHEFVICAVSQPFVGFEVDELDKTQSILVALHEDGQIDHVISGSEPVKEVDARGAALRWLLAQGVTLTWMADSDEFTTLAEVGSVLRFVQSRPGITAFRGSLKNYILDERTYMVEPFNPMRIHRTDSGSYTAYSFWDDNNVLYRGSITRDFKRDIDFPTLTIPRTVCFTPHMSWTSDERGRRKQAYQRARWVHCSFKWNEKVGKLEWDESYFAKTGEPIPETAQDFEGPATTLNS